MFCCVKQKTAYEMRISDWSSDVCSSDLEAEQFAAAVELLKATGDTRYAEVVTALWPKIAGHFVPNAVTAVSALADMPPSYRAALEPAVRAWAAQSAEIAVANPYGVPVTTGGWAGNGAVMDYGLTAYALHKAFPEIVGADPVFRSIDFLLGNHPGSDISFVSGVGTRSKEVARSAEHTSELQSLMRNSYAVFCL